MSFSSSRLTNQYYFGQIGEWAPLEADFSGKEQNRATQGDSFISMFIGTSSVSNVW